MESAKSTKNLVEELEKEIGFDEPKPEEEEKEEFKKSITDSYM